MPTVLVRDLVLAVPLAPMRLLNVPHDFSESGERPNPLAGGQHLEWFGLADLDVGHDDPRPLFGLTTGEQGAIGSTDLCAITDGTLVLERQKLVSADQVATMRGLDD